MANKKTNAELRFQSTLSPARQRVFLIIMVSLPFLFLLFLEAGLRIFNYGGNLDLFIPARQGYEKFLQCNPDVAKRYFYAGSVLPNPPVRLFRKQKSANGYRIFVLGESSVVGFPYSNNASFPNMLERGLARAFPEKQIEVVAVAMSAINSYALVDLIDEVMDQSPDALLIYTGHNEYYGALGVGSVQSLGHMRWLIRAYLKLQSWETFLLLRNGIGWAKVHAGRIVHGENTNSRTETLMTSIVEEQTISYGSPLYEAGKKQFEENMDIILRKATKRGVPVLLSELVSNLGGQEPFISLEDAQGQSAKSFFAMARTAEKQKEYEKAGQWYAMAKDFDALRFRAPEDFNAIIRTLAQHYSLYPVPMRASFEKESPNGIPGNTLFLEHLHPNHHGYYLMAKAFYDAMETGHLISSRWPKSCMEQEQDRGFTELDSVYAAINIHHLKSGWPFQPGGRPNNFIRDYRPSSPVEEIAFHAATKPAEYSLEEGHLDLGDAYAQQGRLDMAFAEYDAALASVPQESLPYLKVAKVNFTEKKYAQAFQVLYKSLYYKETGEIDKWLGIAACMRRQFPEAVHYLEKADVPDPEVDYYLSSSCYLDNQWNKGEEYFERLKKNAPQSDYVAKISKLRSMMQNEPTE